MKKSFALILLTSLAIGFVSCSNSVPPRKDTVFHNAEDSPRAGNAGNSRRPKYGANGTESPTAMDEAEASKRRAEARALRNRSINSDPNGIVKPHDLDAEGETHGYTGPAPENGGDPSSGDGTGEDPSITETGTEGGDPPFAEAVPGESGFVYSPFVTNKAEAKVSIQDDDGIPYPPGTVMPGPDHEEALPRPVVDLGLSGTSHHSKEPLFSTVAVLGPGLLGGSVALAAKDFGAASSVRLWARRDAAVEDILSRGIADFASTDLGAVLEGADCVVLATPIGAMAGLVVEIVDVHHEGELIITDVGSVKGSVVAALDPVLESHDSIHYVGSHPMAGKEQAGIEHASARLFQNAACVITPGASSTPTATETVSRFWQSVGCRTLEMRPERARYGRRPGQPPAPCSSLAGHWIRARHGSHCGKNRGWWTARYHPGSIRFSRDVG